MTNCPRCERPLITTTETGEEQLLCDLKNEGGLQEGLDILPILTEESYLKAYPEERKCRAFLEFCGEGDVEAIVNLLKDVEGEDEVEAEDGGERTSTAARDIDILRYQDPIGSMRSGLHVAIQNEQEEVVWLLLYLASGLDLDKSPGQMLMATHDSGIRPEDRRPEPDIRTLENAEGITPGLLARSMRTSWGSVLEDVLLMLPGG